MADAGSEWEKGIASFGDSIGSAIEEMGKRHRQEEDRWGQLTALRGMDDPNHPGKSLLPDKVWAPLEEMHNRHKAINEGQANLLIKFYTGLAGTAAKAKIKTEEQQVTPWVQNGKVLGYLKNGVPHPFQKHTVDELSGAKPKAKPDTITKKLNTTLAPYGLDANDLSKLDEKSLHYQDENGDKIAPGQGAPPTLLQRLHVTSRQKPDKQKEKEMLRTRAQEGKPVEGAAFVGGTANGKDFQIPVKKWHDIRQAHQNMQTVSGAGDGGETTGVSDDPVLQKAKDAISRGANPEDVKKRLIDAGYDDISSQF